MSRVLCYLVATFLTAPLGLSGQEEVDPLLSGRLLLGGEPADSGTVVLHRVTPEEAGNIDSTRVSPDGTFTFRLPNLPIPGSGEVFFVSSRYDGVLYAGDPISDPVQLDSMQSLEAFPTEAVGAGGAVFPVSRREVWIDEGPLGWEVTDVLEIRNPGLTTLISASDEGVVWRYPLPPSARSPRLIQTGPSTGTVRFEDGMMAATNPVLPAENYYVVQYDLDSLSFDIPMPGQTGLVQVLVRESAPEMRVEGLARQPDAEIEVGTTFRLWAGEALSEQTLQVRTGEESDFNGVAWLAVGLALLLVGVGGWLVQRSAPSRVGVPTGAAPSGGGSRDHPGPRTPRLRRDVLIEVARLDEEFAEIDSPGVEETARYRRRRAELLAELSTSRSGEANPPVS